MHRHQCMLTGNPWRCMLTLRNHQSLLLLLLLLPSWQCRLTLRNHSLLLLLLLLLPSWLNGGTQQRYGGDGVAVRDGVTVKYGTQNLGAPYTYTCPVNWYPVVWTAQRVIWQCQQNLAPLIRFVCDFNNTCTLDYATSWYVAVCPDGPPRARPLPLEACGAGRRGPSRARPALREACSAGRGVVGVATMLVARVVHTS